MVMLMHLKACTPINLWTNTKLHDRQNVQNTLLWLCIRHTQIHKNSLTDAWIIIYIQWIKIGLTLDCYQFSLICWLLCPETHTVHTHLCVYCVCSKFFAIVSVQHLSEPFARVNKPSPWREGPANEVYCMLLHCVTQQSWPASRSMGLCLTRALHLSLLVAYSAAV